MTAIEDRMAPKALAMIAKHGLSATYVTFLPDGMQEDGGVDVDVDGDGGDGTYTVTISLPVPVQVEYGDATARESVTTTWIAGSGLAFVPKTGDTVTIEGGEWHVVAVNRYGSIATPITYRLTLRGGE